MKTFKCDGCGEVAKHEHPDGWISVKVRVKLVRPLEDGINAFGGSKYNYQNRKHYLHFHSSVCMHKHLGLAVAHIEENRYE